MSGPSKILGPTEILPFPHLTKSVHIPYEKYTLGWFTGFIV